MTDISQTPETEISLEEAAKNLGVNEYVLKFWLREFKEFGFSGVDFFSDKDLKLALLIKRLLYDECFTLKGVKRRLSGYDFTTLVQEGVEKEEKDEIDSEKEEKNGFLMHFFLDCKKNMDIISSHVEDIIRLTNTDK